MYRHERKSLEECKKDWSETSSKIKIEKSATVLQSGVSSAVSSRSYTFQNHRISYSTHFFRASTPVHQTQVIYHGESSEDLTRPNTPNPFPSNQSVSSFKQEEVTLKLEPVTEEKSDDKVVLSEGEDSSGEIDFENT